MQEQPRESIDKDPEERIMDVPTGKPTAKRKGWKKWLNYQSVVKQVPFFLFLALLAVIYIYNGHYADKTIRAINLRTKEVKELQYDYIDVKSKVMGQSKQSELVKAVEPMGLKELVGSPVVLKDSVAAVGN